MRTSLLIALIIVLGAGAASASDWFDDNVEIHGFARTALYARFPDYKADSNVRLSSLRTELNLEMDIRLYQDRDWNVEFVGVFRPTFEPVMYYQIHPEVWGDNARGGDFDPLTLGAATAPEAIQGGKFPGHGGCIVGEFCLGNGHVGTLFSDELEPALVIDDVVFYGATTAPWLSRSGAGKIVGNAMGRTYEEYLNSNARTLSATARLTDALEPIFGPGAGPIAQGFVNQGTQGLQNSLAMASRPLETPLNEYAGALGDRSTFHQAPFDVNRTQNNLAFDCIDNAHEWCFVREAFFQVDWRDTSVRVGRQQIVWGKTDALRLQDNVNPTDNGFHNIFPSLEERRIPQLALDVLHSFGDVGPVQDVSLEFVWIFDRFTPMQFGQCGEAYAYTLACQGRADAAAHQLFNFALAKVDERKWNFANTEPGVRLEFLLPEPEMSFSFSLFYGQQDLPMGWFRNHYSVDNPNPAAMLFLQGQGLGPLVEAICAQNAIPECAGGAGSTPWTTGFDPYKGDGTLADANAVLVRAWQNAFTPLGDCDILGLTGEACLEALQAASLPWTASEVVLQYPRVLTIGASTDYQVPNIDTILRLEMAFDINRGISNTAKQNLRDHSGVLLMALGIDRPTYIPFISPDRTALLSFQTFWEHVVDYDGGTGAGDGMVVDEHAVITTFLHEHYWRNDSLILTNLLAYDWRAKALILGPSFKWLVSQNVYAQVGMNFLWGGANRPHNLADLCPDATLDCLSDPTSWNPGQWQALNKGYARMSQSPWWSKQGFADRFQERRDEFWMSLTYQF